MVRVRNLAWILIAVIFVLCPRILCPQLHALDDWQPINPEELKMTADPAHPTDAVILYHEEMTDDNQSHSSTYMRVKILTEKGKEQANIRIRYDGTNIHVIDVKARTIAPDGTITPFSGKVFDRTIVKGHGIKYLAKSLTLSDVQVGSIIEWKYSTYWEGLAYAPHWIVQEDLPQKRAKFTFVPLTRGGKQVVDEHGEILDRVYYQAVGFPQTSIKTSVDGKMFLELQDVPAFEEEEFSPPSDLLKERVNFYYGTSSMQKAADFWKDEGKLWSKDVDKFIGHSSAIATAAGQLVGPSDSPEQKVRKIYAQIQKMKNLNYDHDESLLAEILSRRNSKEKRSVDDVLRNSAGFRDELTRTFVAMVRAVNMPAFVMRLSDRDEVFFQPNMPYFSQLTSEIAIVPIDGKDVFLDPGTPLCPYGLLKWQHTGTQGLRQAGGGSELAQTPAPDYRKAVTQRVGRMTLAEDGGLSGKITVAWSGEEAIAHRLSEYNTDAAGRKKDLEDEITRLLPAGATVHLDFSSGWDDPEKQLSATFTAEIPSYAATTGKRMLVPNALFEANSRQPFAHGERKLPLYFSYPFYNADDVQITLPSGLQVENLPQTAPVKSDYAFYDLKRNMNGNVLSLARTFAMGGIAFKKEEYDNLRKFYSGVAAGDSEQVVLTLAAK